MDSAVVSLQDVGNIVSFVAPGYFAIQTYSLIYAKRERNFSKLLIESVIFSLPIVTLTNVLWEKVLRENPVASLNIRYAFLLLMAAILGGVLVAVLRKKWPLKDIALLFDMGSPDGDFVKTQLERMSRTDPDRNTVTVSLKGGSVFSGTVDRISRHPQGPRYYCFANLAWYDSDTEKWIEQGGNIIVERNEIEYIVTPELEDQQSKPRLLPKTKAQKKKRSKR